DPQTDNFTCGPPTDLHRGHVDWGPALGQSIFRYGFQCAPSSDNALGVSAVELSTDQARRAHVLYPTRFVKIEITPGHPDKRISPGKPGELSVALLGSTDLDVRKAS